MARKWDTGALDAVWISDITYLRTDEGWVDLCAVRNACSRRVIGWRWTRCRPAPWSNARCAWPIILRGGPAGVMFHADRGTQYTSSQLNDVCTDLGIQQSVGRTGACGTTRSISPSNQGVFNSSGLPTVRAGMSFAFGLSARA
ncbi:DDE-type integrase/transposase/recombinase [Pseudarthrobacter sp. NS4]|uniref:DDE-type integrase/transposase/recombinase n=1 Tax=Pseudarthrobacter sp. NS4 TaxID=2973976 RepID=UPI0037C9DEE1